MKQYRLEICPRVNLWVSNTGFLFSQAMEPRPDEQSLRPWREWGDYWPLYTTDGIQHKVFAFLDTFPDRFKTHIFFQALHF